MMISQLATVAIKARLRVSPATVLPKLVIRSKSKSLLFSSALPRAVIWTFATSGSRSVRRVRVVVDPGAFPSPSFGATTSNRAAGFSMVALARVSASK